jgi:tRNA pseudouridine55 synthase
MAARSTPDGVLLLDKPEGITSTRALAMAKRALAASKAGHTGTLDPFATGLLPLVFGEATKFSRFILDATKAYDATLVLGQESETGDTESAPRRITHVIPESRQIVAVLSNFTGDILQIPPMHSAVHIAGRRLYEYAREGREVPREARQVHVSSLEMQGLSGATLALSVVCSKGTYVRVLAADIGRALGCGAYLAALRRTRVGPFRLEDAVTLETLSGLGTDGARARLQPAETLVVELRRVDLDADRALRFRQGQAVAADGLADSAPRAVFDAGRAFLGVGLPEGERLAPLRLLAGTPKSPDFA